MQKILKELINRVRRAMPTACPLCGQASLGGALCAPCEFDCFGQRQARRLCEGCALVIERPTRGDQDTDCSDSGIRLPRCSSCRLILPDFDRCASALDYAFPAKLLIEDFKQQGRLWLAPVLADLMWRAFLPLRPEGLPDAWVPVPASRLRLAQSGFSPPQQLALYLARRSGIGCRLDWLTRLRETTPQKTASRSQRQASLVGIFAATCDVAGRRIGLVDDVMTTGATASEAARAFKARGAREVIVLTAARTPLVWQNHRHV